MSRRANSLERGPSGNLYLGSEIRLLREQHSFTLRQLAELIDYHPASLSKIETNAAKPSNHLLEIMAQHLSVSFDYLKTRPIHPRVQEKSRKQESGITLLTRVESSINRLTQSVDNFKTTSYFDPAGFATVDQAHDPGRFVHYLESTSSIEQIRAYKRQTYDLLEVQEGDRILEAGCGTGEDALELAELVGCTGLVVGIDNSETIINRAQNKAKGTNLQVNFVLGDIHDLKEFANDTFNGCRIDRVLQHVKYPRRALAELVRVAKPGARVVAFEVDWETLTVSPGDPELTRVILTSSFVRNRWLGRQLLGLFQELDLREISIVPVTGVYTDFNVSNLIFKFQDTVERAKDDGVVSSDEADNWLGALEEASQTGGFFNSVTGFIVAGRKP